MAYFVILVAIPAFYAWMVYVKKTIRRSEALITQYCDQQSIPLDGIKRFKHSYEVGFRYQGVLYKAMCSIVDDAIVWHERSPAEIIARI